MQRVVPSYFCSVTLTLHVSWLTLLAELSCIAGQAEAGEGVDSVHTGGSVQTRVGLALVDICRRTTQARIIPRVIRLSVRGSVWLEVKRRTCLAVLSGVSRCAQADVLRSISVAGASVQTHSGRARQEICTQ